MLHDGPKYSPDSFIQDCLRSLGIACLSDWDVLIFVYRHKANLSSADQLARLLGYSSKVVGVSLDRLESQSLIQRSRYSQGVRFYELAPSVVPVAAESCLGQLISLSGTRAGRLVLVRLLKQSNGIHIAAKGRSK